MQPDDASETPSSSAPLVGSSAGRFLRGAFSSGLAVGARTAGALLLNKLLAVYGGPSGLTLLAHFQNLMALFTTLPNDGVHVGIVKYLAPLRAGSGRYRAWLGAGLLLNALALLVGTALLLLGRQALVGVFRPSLGWMVLFAAGIGLLTLNTFWVAVLLAAGRLRAYVWLTAVLSGIGVAGVAGGLYAGLPVENVLLAYLLAQGCTLLPTLGLCARYGLLMPWRGKVSRAATRDLGRFLVMAVSVLLFSKAVDFVMRDVLIRYFSLAQTGMWQAVAKLSDNYTMVFSAVMGSVYYPRLAALIGQPAPLRGYVRTVLLVLAPVVAAGLGLLYLLRDWLLPLLFDAQFAAARDLLAPQFLGDWAKFLTWTFLFILMAKAHVGRYVAVQAGSAVLYAGLLAVLLPRYGLLGAPLAHAARFSILLIGCTLYFRPHWR
jgi:PST family polysaccharide transporter